MNSDSRKQKWDKKRNVSMNGPNEPNEQTGTYSINIGGDNGSHASRKSRNRNSLNNTEMNFFARSYVGSFTNTFTGPSSGVHENTGDSGHEQILPVYTNDCFQGVFSPPLNNIHTNDNLHKETVALSHVYDNEEDDKNTQTQDRWDGVDNYYNRDDNNNNNNNRDSRTDMSFDTEYAATYEYGAREHDNDSSTKNNGAVDLDAHGTEHLQRQLEEQPLLLLSAVSSNASSMMSINYSSMPFQEPHLTGNTPSPDTSVPLSGASRNTDWNEIVRYVTDPVFTTKQSIKYMPSVVLGLLLNILDALSYGMIIFPITEPIFKNLGPAGMSLFYISSVVSQLCFSCGLSDFGCSIGSEMIEVTPFFHTMAALIANHYNNDTAHKDAIVATTIVSYCLSSIITGLTFYSLGKLRLGKIVGFFPRHILIGCIGGVGYFLCITGIEVSTKISKFQYNLGFLKDFITKDQNFAKLLLPVVLTIILIKAQKVFKNNSLVLPVFYILTFVLFHFVVIITPQLSLTILRDSGWVFPMSQSDEAWYDVYSLFKFNLVNWSLVLANLPTMMALTFFGILHVPINVPALAMSIGCDKYDVDKELIAHGYSNFISGMIGSIQNYLVYTNSVLFIRAGADSRFAGVLLAIMTFVVMVIGPVLISLIPICIVGSLIFLLGYELMKEALFDTLGKLSVFEYLTIFIIVVTMGIFDFVLGIIVGILIACFSFLVDSTKLKTVNGEFDGTVAHSTVNRDFWQTQLLNEIGRQIYVLKLQNLLFFGTIISIEEKIDNMLNNEKVIIKYLILDFKNINADNIDYSAAEGFNRIKRFLDSKKIHLIISSIKETDLIYSVFNKVGLLQGVELFGNLNSALEWCENRFLSQYKTLQEKKRQRLSKLNRDNPKHQLKAQIIKYTQKNGISTLSPNSNIINNSMQQFPFESNSKQRNAISQLASTPRNNQFFNVAKNIYSTEQVVGTNLQEKYDNNLVLQNFLYSLKMFIEPQDFNKWEKVQSYFKLHRLPPGEIVDNDNCFFFVDYGLLKISYFVMSNNRNETIYETISNRCAYGKICGDGYAKVAPTYKDVVLCETECSIWLIDQENLKKMRAENPILYTDMVILISALNQYRYKKLLAYSLVSS